MWGPDLSYTGQFGSGRGRMVLPAAVCVSPSVQGFGPGSRRCKKRTHGSVGLRGLLSMSGLVASWVLWLLVGFSFGRGMWHRHGKCRVIERVQCVTRIPGLEAASDFGVGLSASLRPLAGG